MTIPTAPYPCTINSLAPGRYGNILKSVIPKHMLQIKLISTSSEWFR